MSTASASTDVPSDVPGSNNSLELGHPHHHSNNRRSFQGQRAYPIMLIASTLIAGAFCYLYITKPYIEPVVVQPATAPATTPVKTTPKTEITKAKPDPQVSPTADKPVRPEVVAPQELVATKGEPFEETNLKIQHVLGATGPGGEDLGRIMLEVPVLYQSGTIRWTQQDVNEARALLVRINEYQQRSRALRDEAVTLISQWDDLMIRSIPDAVLRVDSPTLPENQGVGTADQAPIKSTESIEIDQ